MTINTFATAPKLWERPSGPWPHRHDVDVAVIVYDVTKPESLENIKDWILNTRSKYMRKSEYNPHGNDCLYYIVANKIDLTSDKTHKEGLEWFKQYIDERL